MRFSCQNPFTRYRGPGYETDGYVCQAEELLVGGRWKRYFGFVSKHGAAVVPASQVAQSARTS